MNANTTTESSSERAIRLGEECAIYIQKRWDAIPDESKAILCCDHHTPSVRDHLELLFEIHFWRSHALGVTP